MKYFCLLLLSIFSLTSISGVYAENIRADLSENLLRMHIIANSDSEKDQSIKLMVRDEILNAVKNGTEPPELYPIIDEALKNAGAEYSFTIDITRTFVPEKTYKNIRLPEGYYHCINVILGDGAGENWWCVAYPPLCFTESVFGELSDSGRLLLEDKLDPESLRAIVYGGNVNIRFRIVDEFIKLKDRLW